MAEDDDKPVTDLLFALRERAKELNCLYKVEELFSLGDITLRGITEGIVEAIPTGWQFTEVCEARITIGEMVVQTPGFHETPWRQDAKLIVQGDPVGSITVCYTEERPEASEGPFLKEERKLIETIADRLERRILHENLRVVFEKEKQREGGGVEWRVILDLLRRTDPKLLSRITRRMLHHLAWGGIQDAIRIVEDFNTLVRARDGRPPDENQPSARISRRDMMEMSDQIFALAAESMSESDILASIQKWIKEDRSGFLVRILENPISSLGEIINAVERFHYLANQGLDLSIPRDRSIRVSLIRRLLSDHPTYIGVARKFLDTDDFYELLRRIIHPAGSHGRLGGKGAGLVLASHILSRVSKESKSLGSVKTPRTWYLTSDGLRNFVEGNDLEEIIELKYSDIGHVRQEYPYIVHVFKNSPLPPEIVNGLSVALDDFGEVPLIVRSSSLLEDRLGTSFAGKYRSLFIANQGSKRERLGALMDAILEVYASTFAPDPIEYRTEHGLLDFHEEMGILIQEVVGTKVGNYFLPAFAGVAFSDNDFRWSKRIRREDGLIRMVPGLGTRAVDRMSDDYPILIAPGQPSLRVNVTPDEKVRYSPRYLDVINLETNVLETIEVRDLLKECMDDYPMVHQLVSILRDGRLEQPTPLTLDATNEHLVVTFEGLVSRTPFVEQVRTILGVLRSELRMPVDIEFAHDGSDLYLLQCRPQSHGKESQPATIPHDVPRDRIVFTANRYVSNGRVPGITHIVYVDPQQYASLHDRSELLAVGRAVGRLNEILPKRQFILMGPGRWGSRGDIQLGVSVTYADISNTGMLLEIARRTRDYVPELSFGTHFFQDLVEAVIRYLPLYPDEEGVVFNESFLTESPNMFADLVPELARLSDVIRVIDVPHATGGLTLEILMNGDSDEAVALLGESSPDRAERFPALPPPDRASVHDDIHWQWRLLMVEEIAARLDPERFGVQSLYLFGSTKNATAGPESDIDLLVHFRGTDAQRCELTTWLEAWSMSLAHTNYLRTGRRSAGLLDVHLISDDDIRRRSSYASKIGASTDAARPIPIGARIEPT